MKPEKLWTQYLYYGIIFIVSLISLIFLPMIGSDLEMGFNFPNTTAGWVVYIISQLIIAIINVLIFHSFICQSKINIKDNENYKKAVEILRVNKEKTYIPRSLEKFNTKEYLSKGVSIFLSSIMAVFALGQAILTYDYAKLLSYLFTILMGIIFGIIEMKKYEEYYTTEYLDYAVMIQEINLKEENNDNTSKWESIEEPGRASTEEQR